MAGRLSVDIVPLNVTGTPVLSCLKHDSSIAWHGFRKGYWIDHGISRAPKYRTLPEACADVGGDPSMATLERRQPGGTRRIRMHGNSVHLVHHCAKCIALALLLPLNAGCPGRRVKAVGATLSLEHE